MRQSRREKEKYCISVYQVKEEKTVRKKGRREKGPQARIMTELSSKQEDISKIHRTIYTVQTDIRGRGECCGNIPESCIFVFAIEKTIS